MKDEQMVSELCDINTHTFYNEKLQGYKKYRKIKRDGNCLYLSIGVQLIEYLREHKNLQIEWNNSISKLKNNWKYLKIEEITYEDCFEGINNLIEDDCILEETDKYRWLEIIYFVKLVVMAEIKTNSKKYQAYLCESVENYCKYKVEPFYIDAGYVEIGALVSILPFSINVVDVTEGSSNIARNYGSSTNILTILHTPNHFEPLYK